MISYSICLSLTYFPKQSTLQVHSYCCKWHNFILLFWLSTYIICIYVVYTYIYICLAGYSPWGCKESDTTERLSTAQTHTHTHAYIYTYIYLSLPHLLCPFICSWALGWLPYLSYCKIAAMNIRMHASFETFFK